MPEEARPKPVFTVPLDESQTECAISGERLEAVLDSNDVRLPASNACCLVSRCAPLRKGQVQTSICNEHQVRLCASHMWVGAVVA